MLRKLGADPDDVAVFHVPGAFEIPPVALQLARASSYHAVICVGAVIRGATPHFDYVAGEAAKGVSNVSLETGIPVMFGVVTTDTVEQAINRSGLKAGNKGYEAAMAAIEVANLYREMASTENKGKGKAFPHVV